MMGTWFSVVIFFGGLVPASPPWPETALAELRKPEPSASILKQYLQHCRIEKGQSIRLRDQLFEVYRAYSRRASELREGRQHDDHERLLAECSEILAATRLSKRQVKTLFGDFVAGAVPKRGVCIDILYQNRAMLVAEIRDAISLHEGRPFDVDTADRMYPFLSDAAFVRHVEAAYAHCATKRRDGSANVYRDILLWEIGDAATLDFLRHQPPPFGEPPSAHKKGLEFLRRRLVRQYRDVGLDPPPILLPRAEERRGTEGPQDVRGTETNNGSQPRKRADDD